MLQSADKKSKKRKCELSDAFRKMKLEKKSNKVNDMLQQFENMTFEEENMVNIAHFNNKRQKIKLETKTGQQIYFIQLDNELSYTSTSTYENKISLFCNRNSKLYIYDDDTKISTSMMICYPKGILDHCLINNDTVALLTSNNHIYIFSLETLHIVREVNAEYCTFIKMCVYKDNIYIVDTNQYFIRIFVYNKLFEHTNNFYLHNHIDDSSYKVLDKFIIKEGIIILSLFNDMSINMYDLKSGVQFNKITISNPTFIFGCSNKNIYMGHAVSYNSYMVAKMELSITTKLIGEMNLKNIPHNYSATKYLLCTDKCVYFVHENKLILLPL